MREVEAPMKPSALSNWIFWGVLSGLMSMVLVAAWQGLSAPTPQVVEVKKPGEVPTPLQLLQRRVDAGDPEAQRLMALRYRDGNDVLRSAEETLRLLNASIKGGDVQSIYELACIYDAGIPGVTGETDIAWNLFKDSAMAGNINAMAYLSEVYEGGSGLVPRNLIEAYAWRSLAIFIGSQSTASVPPKWNGPATKRVPISGYAVPSDFIYNAQRWLSFISLTNADILLAQKRSRELLKEIEVNKAKK